MNEKDLFREAVRRGFGSIDDFVRQNLHYLPKDRRRLFKALTKYVVCGGRHGKN